MVLARSWGAANVDEALALAAERGFPDCMVLARAWGAADLGAAHGYAAANGHAFCVRLIERWEAALGESAARPAAIADAARAPRALHGLVPRLTPGLRAARASAGRPPRPASRRYSA